MDTDAVLTLMQEVAQEYVTPRFRSLATGEIAEKAPGDLVTVADQEAEVALTQALSAAYPGAVILGEEASSADPECFGAYARADHAFTIDPVDGTKNFVRGSVDHAVMVAELRSGVCVRSWIWQPQHQRSYVAERGSGVWRGRQRLSRGPTPMADQVRAVTSIRSWLGAELGVVGPLELTWVCCGLDYPKLIEGEADAIVYGGTHPWDHAPGTLMVTEAGGYAATFAGEPYDPTTRPRGLLVCGDRATYELVAGHTRALTRR
ncbi:MAG: inositol monophosphatase family protein [Ornithinimicrobium sp.]